MGFIIGAHVSAAGGLEKVFARAEELGAEAIQMFGSSPRQWAVALPSTETVKKFQEARENSRVQQVFLHAPYLINIGHPDREMRGKSVKALVGHFEICRRIAADGVIFHIGSGRGASRDEIYKRVVEGIRAVLDAIPEARLIIENSAGEGDKIGATLEEIARLIEAVGSDRVGVCIDTAHSFASGLLPLYTPESVSTFFDHIDATCGRERLWAIHINDSKVPAGAKKDRHENIGAGHIGLEGFRAFVREPRVDGLPLILEVPGFDGAGPDQVNVCMLKSLI